MNLDFMGSEGVLGHEGSEMLAKRYPKRVESNTPDELIRIYVSRIMRIDYRHSIPCEVLLEGENDKSCHVIEILLRGGSLKESEDHYHPSHK